MSLIKFFNTIDNGVIGRFISLKQTALEKLDPKRIYIENVRRLIGVPTSIAKFLCEMAVRQGYLSKHYGVFCNSCKRLIASYNAISDIPEEIYCQTCELNEEPTFNFKKSEVEVTVFYKLQKRQ